MRRSPTLSADRLQPALERTGTPLDQGPVSRRASARRGQIAVLMVFIELAAAFRRKDEVGPRRNNDRRVRGAKRCGHRLVQRKGAHVGRL